MRRQSIGGSQCAKLLKNKIRRPLRPAPGRPPAAAGPRPLRRRHFVSRPMVHARGALARGARKNQIDRCEAALALPGVHAVWTAGRRRAYSADPVSPDRPRNARALPAAGAGARVRALCRRAGGGGFRRRSIPRRRRRRSGRGRHRAVASNARSDRSNRAVFEDDLTTEAGVVRKAYGDVDAAFRNAHAVVALELSIGRHSGVPMETRGAIARYDEARDILEMHGAAKVPHWNRDTLGANAWPERESVQLYEGHVGGGFGIRGELYPEDVLVCAAALKFRKPIKWIEDRREHLIAANHSRQQHHKIRAAIDAHGHILGIDDEFFHDNGAYMRTHAATVPDLAAAMLPGPYVVPAYRAVGHIRLTNKTPCGTYRAPGRYESTFVRERLLDAIAAKVGVDKVEIRRRNLIAKSAMPYALGLETLGTHIVYDSGDYSGLLDKALAAADWPALQQQLRKRRAERRKSRRRRCDVRREKRARAVRHRARRGHDRRAGRGHHRRRLPRPRRGDGDRADLRRRARRRLRQYPRHPRPDRPHRQGHGRLCLARHGDVRGSDAAGRDQAARQGASPCRRIDADQRGGARYRQRRNRAHRHRGRPFDAAGRARARAARRIERRGYLRIHAHGLPYGVHVAAVRVDADTGAVTIERYVIAYDIGKAVNPKLVEGQIAGGLAQGVGGALLEEFLYDENGEPLSVSFADYLMPTAREVPEVSILVTEDAPSPLNPLGLKGAGEGGANPVGAVIASAIDDALGIPGAVTQLPISPQRLKAILRGTTKARP